MTEAEKVEIENQLELSDVQGNDELAMKSDSVE